MPVRPVDQDVPTTTRGAALRARRGHRHHIAAWGEDVAARYVTSLGWRMVARNWVTDIGEADIIALDGEGWAVLVEVRTRTGTDFGTPLESITPAKLHKLTQLALVWRRQHPEHHHIRVDVIGVLRRNSAEPQITHVRGVGQ
mgnify:FL=1